MTELTVLEHLLVDYLGFWMILIMILIGVSCSVIGFLIGQVIRQSTDREQLKMLMCTKCPRIKALSEGKPDPLVEVGTLEYLYPVMMVEGDGQHN